MQIIQSPLGNNVHPLGVRSSLSYPHKMLLRKESNSLHSQSNIISPIQTKPPLVTSSKFLLSRKHESTIQPLIDWDNGETQGINSEFPLIEFDSCDSINLLKNSNINSNESVKDSIPEIMPTRIEKNTSNDTSEKVNTKGKSKSTKTNKSQQPPEKKSKPKSKTKKTVKSSAAKNVAQFIDESNISINRNQDSLLVSDEPLPVETNSDLPKLQRNVASNNTTSDNDSVSSITPSIMSSTSPSVEDKSTLFRNITNDDLQLNSELPSSLPSPELEAIAPKMSATSPETGSTAIAPKMSATSPETGSTASAPKVSATSPEISETASIFTKIIDNEQTVESEFPFAVTNPEISTFVDTSNNPTSPQDEVSTPPEVEQNSLQTLNFKEPEEKTSPETPTKVDSFPDTSLQLKSAGTHSPQIYNSLVPSSLGLNIGKQKLSILDSPQLNTLQNKTTDVGKPSSQYSSPTLIFRKANLTNHIPSQGENTPSKWSSVEELLNGNNDQFTSSQQSDIPSQWSSVEELLDGNNDQFTNDVKSNKQKSSKQNLSKSSQVFAKHLPSAKGLTADRKATPSDIFRREIEPVTHTIKNTYLSSKDDKDDKVDSCCGGDHKGNDKGDTADFDALAREIYNRLRHRIEIERERHGHFSGRLAW